MFDAAVAAAQPSRCLPILARSARAVPEPAPQRPRPTAPRATPPAVNDPPASDESPAVREPGRPSPSIAW
jgi:hypothetical protein